MEITEIKVFPIQEEKLKAFVSIVLDHCFMVNDIKVIRGKDGLFISMPSRRKKNGRFKDVAHPLNNETRQMMEAKILAEYERAVDGAGAETRSAETRSETGQQPEERAAKPAEPAADAAADETEARSLEEVAELHLKDSFWST